VLLWKTIPQSGEESYQKRRELSKDSQSWRQGGKGIFATSRGASIFQPHRLERQNVVQKRLFQGGATT
ncbi:MAG: hypothetical protein J1E06_00810, partial [Acutalibacter sp.]|nr:hypothetical protein [Acutalibacter sp.]